jgi:hypothetical protein
MASVLLLRHEHIGQWLHLSQEEKALDSQPAMILLEMHSALRSIWLLAGYRPGELRCPPGTGGRT